VPVQSAIAAIVLAAGSSTRFGEANKLLVRIDDVPLVVRVIEAIKRGGIEQITVVTGYQSEPMTAAITGHGCRIVHNDRHTEGMGTSVARGVSALADDVDGVLIAQGDMPEVDGALIATLRQRFVENAGDRVVYPVLDDGRQGNPVLWPKRLFGELAKLTGDKGAKQLIAAEGDNAIRAVSTGSAAAVDIDTPEELAAYEASRSSQPR
jgi:molybdenum cofactor cytidylyltransferase